MKTLTTVRKRVQNLVQDYRLSSLLRVISFMAQNELSVAKLRQKLQVQLVLSHGYSILTTGQSET